MPFSTVESGPDAFIVSGAQPRHIDLNRTLTLTGQTQVQVFSAAQGPGVSLWAVDAANAQAMLDGRTFEGISLNPRGEFGLSRNVLPGGVWYFGATGSVPVGQSVQGFVDVSVLSAPGETGAGNIPMAANGNPGAWRAVGFTVTGAPHGYVETEASGGRFMIMTDVQFQDFQAAARDGFSGGAPAFVDLGATGGAATGLQGEFTLAPGAYQLVWLNDTGGWAGGGANLSFFTGPAGGFAAPNGSGAVVSTDLPSAGPDLLVANAAFAQVHAGGGDDTIVGALTADYLRGDDGNDLITGGQAFDDINGNLGNDTLSGGLGDDWVVGGKDNDVQFGGAGGDVVWGNLGNDTLDGGDGNDQVRGGQGNDIVNGGAGDDYVSGDRGDDTVSGGAGADRFHGSQDAGIDRVVDFHASEGDRVQLDPGTTYVVAQVGADTVIDMGGGHQMILVGVQLSTLAPGWIFLG